MKVVAKFALAFFLATVLIIAGYVVVSAQRQSARIEDAIAVDLRSLGDDLRSAIRASWESGGEAEALRVIAAARSGRRDVEIRWIAGAPASNDDVLEEERDGERRLKLALPVSISGAGGGTLVLSRPIPDAASILKNDRFDDVVLLVVLALALGAIAVAFGVGLIGRPLDRIVEQARRIGGGDFTQRLREDRSDEIGDLKRELNAMCAKLEGAQRRADDEAAARLETLEQLRHLDRLRSVGTMASSFAHELGTPLNVVLLRGQSLVSGETGADELGDAGRTIVGQVEKMSRIVRQMLDFSRPKEAVRERVDARALALRTVDLLSGIAKRHRVRLSARGDEALAIEGDPGEIEQALTNLVMNAIQATPSGGAVEIVLGSAVARAPTVGASTARRTSAEFPAVTFDVVDEGPGIDEPTLARIFEPFYTTKRTGEGTGLGLSVASGIAEDHGGFVSARSEPGRGSTFTLTLPRAS